MSLLEYKGYYGSVEVSPEDDCLFGKVQFIRDLISYEGKSLQELRACFQSAIDDHLEFCKEEGIEPEQTFKGSLNIRPGANLHRKAAIAAECMDVSLNEFIKIAIEEKLAHCSK